MSIVNTQRANIFGANVLSVQTSKAQTSTVGVLSAQSVEAVTVSATNVYVDNQMTANIVSAEDRVICSGSIEAHDRLIARARDTFVSNGVIGVQLSSNAGFGIFFGDGQPTRFAAKGSLYLRTDGTTTNDRMYVNTDGFNTWTAVITQA